MRRRAVPDRVVVVVKRATADLLRAVLRLIEADVREWSDAVVQIDEREAAHYVEVRAFMETANRYGIVTREMLLDHQEKYMAHAHPLHPIADNGPHSVKAS